MLSILELRHANCGQTGLGPVTFEIKRGTCVAIIGASGSGKSLLLRAITDLDVSRGTILLDGVDRESISATEWRVRVGYLPAESGWWGDTVAEHFLDWSSTRETIERLGFTEDCGDWPIQHLSTGERQRLGFARLLERGPQALLLDEPTGGLDTRSEAIVEAMVQERLATGSCCLLVTHNVEQMRRLAVTGYELSAGHLREVWAA
jgi:putative ABC transport system ATP-binding protein